MDLTLTEDERLFRDELRAWLADNDPGEMPAGERAVFQWRRDFQRRLAADGCEPEAGSDLASLRTRRPGGTASGR